MSSRWRSITPERRLVVSAICGIVCLAVAGPALGAESTFDGVYTGKRVLTKDSNPSNPSCVTAEDVSVTIQGTTLAFTNSALRNFPIEFNPHQDGSFNEIYVDAGGRSVTIQGRIIGDVIEADATNPPCEHHWHLKKEHQGQ
jgi:hypothetical protein